jgi:putative ABC transport system permease protein
MTMLLIIGKSLRQHAVSTIASVTAIALAGGLIMAVWVLRSESNKAFTSVTGGFDAVLGGRSSKLQLVLNAIFHLEESPGTIPRTEWEKVSKHPAVEVALPIAMGDNYEGYRLVGTTTDLFDRVEYAEGKPYAIAAPGRAFTVGAEEAVAGSFVAERLGLKIGSYFHPFHGLDFAEDKAHEEDFVVTGILEPTGTPADRVIWIPLDEAVMMDGHDARTADQISAVLLKFKESNAMGGFQLDMLYNKRGKTMTLAWPISVILVQLFSKIAWMDQVLALVAYLVVLVATAGILASISNAMNERRREFAILRALGAGRGVVFGVVVGEAAVIAALGMAAAFGVYAIIGGVAASLIRTETGIVIATWAYHPVMWVAPLAVIGLGALAGVWPAGRAYRSDVSSGLSPHS